MSDIRDRTVEAYIRNGGNIRATARELGRSPKTVREHVQKAGITKPVAEGEVSYAEPERRRSRRYLLTAAQNNTHVHRPFWENLLALRDHLGAELHVSRVVYNHHAYLRDGADDTWYDPAVLDFISEKPLEIATGLVWNANVNVLPTAVRPLSGFSNFNGTRSGVFPHTKIAMESVPNGKYEPTKFLYTTGAVTQRNYVQRKAGQKASFHHAYGCLLVECDVDGNWFARQINARDDGSFQDLTTTVQDGVVSTDGKVAAIVWGDIHAAQLDELVEHGAWGDGGMLDALRPGIQVFHDLLDFRARNHHDRKNCHLEFLKYSEGNDDVRREVEGAATFLHNACRDWCTGVVVASNHDAAMGRWLREADYREDPRNAVFFLAAQLRQYLALEDAEPDFHLLRWAIEYTAPELLDEFDVRFLHADESFQLAGIELGQHGHLGPNGSRGGPLQLSRGGHKAVIGHGHTATILDGLYAVGTSSQIDLGYNAGPSSWSPTHCVIYPSGKRALITMRGSRWRA